ncbi:MAG: hypothetical protein ACKO2P_14845 [Planctomycetota bacterium]
MTTAGNVSVDAQNAVSVAASSGVNATAATISIQANQDGAAGQSFTMVSGTSLITTSSSASAISIRVNTTSGGTGSADLSLLSAVNGRVTVNVQQTSGVGGGAITDANTTAANIAASTALLLAATGIGSSDAIDTQVGTIAFQNSTSGHIQLNELSGSGGFIIGTVGSQTSSANSASSSPNNVVLTAGSPITFAHDVTSAGDLTATATDVGSATDDHITVNAGITVTADNVVFDAGDSIIMNTGSVVQATAASGDVTFRSDVGDQDTTGSMTLNGQILALTGTVTLNLNSQDDATQGAAPARIRGTELLLLSTGSANADFFLDSTDNQIGTLAAATSGDVVVRDTNGGLVIGTIGSTNGITTGTGISSGTGGLVTINVPNGTITVSQAISTVPPASGGTATINLSGSVIVNNTITAEGGNVTLNGSVGVTSDIIVNFALTSGGTMTLSAPRDVILNAVASTTGSGNISITGDSDVDPSVAGGVLITAAGAVTSSGTVLLRGTAGVNLTFQDATPAAVTGFTPSGSLSNLAVQVNADSTPTTAQVSAAGASITIDSHAATSNSDILINGVISTAPSGTVSITADDRASFGTAGDITAGGDVTITAGGGIYTSGDITTTNDNVAYSSAVVLEATVTVTTGAGAGNISFDSTLNGTFNLDLTAGTGNITFTGAVGTTSRLGAVTIHSATTVLSDSTATFTAASFTQVTGVTATTFDGLLNLTGNFDFTSSGTLTLNRAGNNVIGGLMEVTNAGLFTTAVGSNLLVTGSITQNGAGASSIGGNVTSQTAEILFQTGVTLSNHVTVTSGGGTLDNITFSSTIVGDADDQHDLILVAGLLGTVSVTGPVGGAAGGGQRLRTLELVSSNGATFGTTGNDNLWVRTGTSVLITGSRRDADVTFHGAIITPTLSAPADPQRTDGLPDPTEFNDEYDLYLFGDGTHVTTGTLQNTGILQFGDVATDSLIFENGIFATGQSSIYLRGIPRTYGSPVVLGDSDTIVYVYSGTSIIDTTFGGGGSGSFTNGANITIGGHIEGVSGSGGENLTFIAGLAGDVTVGGNAGSINRLGIFLVTSANDVTVNNVRAQRFDQTTGTGTTTTNGTINTNTGLAVNTDNFAPENVATGTGTRSVTLGVNILTTHIVINGLITTTNGGVQLLAKVGGLTADPAVGVVTLNNNGRIDSDLDVILEGDDTTTGIRINALGSFAFGAPGSGDVITGTQRDFVTTSDAPIEFRSNMQLVATPSWLGDRFIVSTVGVAGGTTAKTAPILFAGSVDANYSDLDVRSGHSNVNFRGAVDEVQRLFLRLNDTTVATTATTTSTVTFAADLTVELLLPRPGHYNVDIIGTNTILSENVVQYYLPNDTVFLNTGRTTLGNATGDTVTALYSLDTTASSQTVMAGTINAGYAMNLAPILLAPANQTTTLYTRSYFDVIVQADTFPSSVAQTSNNTLVLGTASSRTNFTFAGDVTVTTLTTTLSTVYTGQWNLTVQGALDITGSGLTTLNNRGALILGSSGGNNRHDLSGGLDASTNNGISVAGQLIAAGPLTLTGGNLLSIPANTTSAITTTSAGTITLPTVHLANSVDLTIGGPNAGAITTGVISGTYYGASSSVRFQTASILTVNGNIEADLDTMEIIGSAGATFNGIVTTNSAVTLTAGTGTTTFTSSVSTATLTAAAGAGDVVFQIGASVSGPATVATTGTVTFGNGPNMFSNPDAFDFFGGLTRSGGNSNVYGTIRATNASVSLAGNVTVTGNSTINAGTGGSSAISLGSVLVSSNTTLTVGSGDTGSVSLGSATRVASATNTTLQLSSSGSTTVSGAITELSVLQVDRGNATFTGAVGSALSPIASVVLVAASGTTTFNGDFYATAVSGAGNAGSISFLGATTQVTNAASFALGGTLTLGGALSFPNGFTSTSATTALSGTLTTVSSPISINSLSSTGGTLTTGSTSSSTITLGAVSGTTTVTAGDVSITGTVSGAGTLTINTAGNVTFRRALSTTGSVVVNPTAGVVTIPGGSAASVNVTATTINLTTAPLFVTGNTLLSATTVTLGTGSGINNSSSANAGTIAITAGAGGFSQALNAGIFTRNNTSTAISLTTTGGGNASIDRLVAVLADNTSAATVTVTVSGALIDINDGSGPATNNVRAGTFTVSGNPVGSVTNPIEYYSSNTLTSANNYWVVSTAPSTATGFMRRFDFTRLSTAVMAGTTGAFASNVYSAATAGTTAGEHFGFTSGQSIAIVQGSTTSQSSYNLYIDSLVQATRVATFNIDTNNASTSHTIRVYFGSAAYATNTIVTLPGQTAQLGAAMGLAVGAVSTATFTATSDSTGTVSFEFKRPASVGAGYWGVYGVDIAQNAGDLPVAFPQMLADVSFDESGLTEESRGMIAAQGFQGRLLDASTVLAARNDAIAAWAAAGITPEQLQSLLATPVVIGDLSADGQLGLARADHIVLDDDAMGLGWFVGSAGEEVPAGMIDLLTVMTHEFGHRLGYEDLDTANHPGHIMAGVLQPGERRSATTARTATVQPIVAERPVAIDRPTEIEQVDLFAGAESSDVELAGRVSLLEQNLTTPSNAVTESTDLRTLRDLPVRLIPEPTSAPENVWGGLSLLDDLFADVVTTLDALN